MMHDFKNKPPYVAAAMAHKNSGPGILAGIATLGLLVAAFNSVHKIDENQVGETLDVLDNVITVTKPGVYFTSPVTPFVKWKSVEKKSQNTARTSDGFSVSFEVQTYYPIPNTYQSEDHVPINHYLQHGAGAAFEQAVGKTTSATLTEKIGGMKFISGLCDEVAQGLPAAKGLTAKKPAQVRCAYHIDMGGRKPGVGVTKFVKQ